MKDICTSAIYQSRIRKLCISDCHKVCRREAVKKYPHFS